MSALHINTTKFEYIAKAFSDLQFYVGACCIDDLSYDIVIVDEKYNPNRAYTIQSKQSIIPRNDTVKLLNVQPYLMIPIIESYVRRFPNFLEGRLQSFLNGYYQLFQ